MPRSRSILIAGLLLAAACSRGLGERNGFPAPTGYVNDYANLLPSAARQELEQLLRQLEQDTTAEVVLATVESLDGMAVEDYARNMFNTWGVGKKGVNNGVLVLVAARDRAMRIQVGYGLEPVLTDERAADIVNNQFLPAFRANDFPRGIITGVRTVADLVRRTARGSATGRGAVRGSRGGLSFLQAVQAVFPGIGVVAKLILLLVCLTVAAERVGTAARTSRWAVAALGLVAAVFPFLVTSFSLSGLWIPVYLVIGVWSWLVYAAMKNPPPAPAADPNRPAVTPNAAVAPEPAQESADDLWIVRHYTEPFAADPAAEPRPRRSGSGRSPTSDGGRTGTGGASGRW